MRMWQRQAILLAMTCAYGQVWGLDTHPQVSELDHDVEKREVHPHIRNGTRQSIETAVAISITKFQGLCAGTVLSSTIVITAGHCVHQVRNKPENITVIAGEGTLRAYPRTSEFEVKQVTIHPKYRHEEGVELIYDLALLKLSTEMPIGKNSQIAAALLPPPGLTQKGTKVQIGGWGKETAYSGPSPVHLTIDVQLHSDEYCSLAYDEYLSGQMFCAGDSQKTTCEGDSGAGGILLGWGEPVLLGVLSFGTQACRSAAVFQKIEVSLFWIFKETRLRYDIRLL